MKNDGGPAFPTTKPLDGWGDPNQGMSLRDYFAGQAMPAMWALILAEIKTGTLGGHAADPRGHAARMSYEQADAMLAERNK